MGNIDMKALFSLTYGMYIVSTDLEGRLNGQIANTVMQITSEPVSYTHLIPREILKNIPISATLLKYQNQRP